MIPFVDLLVGCISFLLLTAVWTTWSRLQTDAQVPGSPGESTPVQDRSLHVRVMSDSFNLSWRESSTLVRSVDVPRKEHLGFERESSVAAPELAAKISEEWNEYGVHKNPEDLKADRAVVHCPDKAIFDECVGVMDAILQKKRQYGISERISQSAFAVALAQD